MSQIHIIDGQKDDILDFITARDIIDDAHVKSLEKTMETYSFFAKGDRRYAEHLEKRNRLIIPDEDGTLMEFVIVEVEKYKDTDGYKVEVHADATYNELRKASILYPGRHEGRSASQHAGFALDDTGWQVGRSESSRQITMSIEKHTNPYEFLGRIATEFDVELKFRVEHNGNRITGRYVDILQRLGDWRGREVTFGHDLDGIRRVEKQDIVTALLGLGPEREDGSRLEVLITDEDALKRWGRLDEFGELHHLIEPYEIQSERSEMTEEEARRYTRTALDKRINTQITYEGTVVDLESTMGHENKKIRFGDTIRIKDEMFNPPLYLEARVFEYKRSIKFVDKTDIKLGDFVEYTKEDVNAIWNQLRDQIANRVSIYELHEYTYDKQTINDKDEQIYEDGKTFAEATGITAEENAKIYADEQDAQIKVDVEKYADDVAEEKAESALDQAKMYAVAKTVYENQMDKIAADMADKADLEYIDGKLVDKVNKGDVYEIEDIDNMINNTVSITQYETDMDGIVQDLESHGTRIGQNADAIGLKADQSSLNAVENSLETKIGNVEVKADAVEISVGEVRADLDGLEIGGRNYVQNGLPNDDSLWKFSQANASGSSSISEGKITITNDDNGYKQWQIWSNQGATALDKLEGDKEYTLSFEIKKDSSVVKGLAHVSIRYQAKGTLDTLRLNVRAEDLTSDWVRYEVKGIIPQEDIDDSTYVRLIAYFNGEGTVSFRKIKLEKSTKATDWSPAPEDTDDAISDVSGRVETLDGEIKAVAGEVSLKASQSVVDSLEGRVSTAEGELRVLPDMIEGKVDDGEARSIFRQEAGSFTFDADQVNFTGHVFGQDAIFKGNIEGGSVKSNSNIDVTTNANVGDILTVGGGGGRDKYFRLIDTGNKELWRIRGYTDGGVTHFSETVGSPELPATGLHTLDGYLPSGVHKSVYYWSMANGGRFRHNLKQTFSDDIQINVFDNILWDGSMYPNATQTVRPTKKLSDCMTGWMLRWQNYTPGSGGGLSNSQFQYTFVPKSQLQIGEGYGVRVVLQHSGGASKTKYIYIDDDSMTGHSTNAGDNNNIVLSGVFEF